MKALWIRVEAHEADSVRVAQLADVLGIEPVHALGHYVALGGQVAEQTPDGHIATIPNKTLETWGKWAGKRDAFARAVREILQDGEGFLVEWRESMGKLIERREKDRLRKSGGKGADVPPNGRGDSTENPPHFQRDSSATVRNGTEPTTTTRPTPSATARAEASTAPTEFTFAYLMELVFQHLYVPDGKAPADWDPARDGSILKELRKQYALSEVAVAIEGLAILREHPGKYADAVDWLVPGEKVTLRALYHSESGVMPMFAIATQAYWKAANARPDSR